MGPYVIAGMIIGLVLVIIHLSLRVLQRKRDFIWYRQLWSNARLPLSRKRVLETYPFYIHLSEKYKKQFEHRVATFIKQKDFKHRYQDTVTDEQVVLIACVACRLTFGRRNYLFPRLNTLLLFPEPFKSPTTQEYHKGEYNPIAKVLAFSWPDFKEGMDIVNDNLHLGLHEFTHVLHIESERSSEIDALRFKKFTRNILRELMKPAVRSKLDNTKFFRDYAFTNQYEFMAVLIEYYFESNKDFKEQFPLMYSHLTKALLYEEEWIIS
ncbi:zinc-dependent peptidase [uncultured Nonlabens sp.]|uniref:zinc-dependent peptidase n=1 Tax=uncultured Nonlabens sp. TaxID=859306 RepID=UPI00261B6E5D|nr:zinc-dependent peptidase [uncultured Nonlabens sp.]